MKTRVKKLREEDVQIHMIENPGIGDRIVDIVVILLCALAAFCCVIPMWHVLMASLSDGKQLLAYEGLAWLPVGKASLDGYKHIFKDASILKGYANSLLYTAGATFLGFVISTMAGYAMSRDTKLKPFMTLFCYVYAAFWRRYGSDIYGCAETGVGRHAMGADHSGLHECNVHGYDDECVQLCAKGDV